jgi:hypothetical protein
MFVQSEKFVEVHGGRIGDISIYGQESNPTTRRLAMMNPAIRGIEGDLGPEHADSFRRDLHPDLKGQCNRRPDIVVFVNGLPLGVIELENAADEDATIWDAWNQLQTYKQEIGSLFHFNEVLVVSDGLQARIGSLTASQEWFKVWRTIAGEETAPASILELEVLVRGVFAPARFLTLLRHFVTFEEDRDRG